MGSSQKAGPFFCSATGWEDSQRSSEWGRVLFSRDWRGGVHGPLRGSGTRRTAGGLACQKTENRPPTTIFPTLCESESPVSCRPGHKEGLPRPSLCAYLRPSQVAGCLRPDRGLFRILVFFPSSPAAADFSESTAAPVFCPHSAALGGRGAEVCVLRLVQSRNFCAFKHTHTHAHTRVYGLEAQVWIDTGHPPCVLGTEERVSGSLCVTLGRASVTRGRGARRRSECYVGLEQRVFLTSNCSQ